MKLSQMALASSLALAACERGYSDEVGEVSPVNGQAGVSGSAGSAGANCPNLISNIELSSEVLNANNELDIHVVLNEAPTTFSLEITNNQQVVRTLISEMVVLKPAQYSAVWNGINDAGKPVPAGIYQARVNAKYQECQEMGVKQFEVKYPPVCEVNVAVQTKDSSSQYAGTENFEMACWNFSSSNCLVNPTLNLLGLHRVGPGNADGLKNNVLYNGLTQVSDYVNINSQTQMAVFDNLKVTLPNQSSTEICVKSDLALSAVGEVHSLVIEEVNDLLITSDYEEVKINDSFPQRGPDILIVSPE